MKKLMVAAVAAAMAGVSVAADCGCADTCSTKCVYAYEVILLAKTTAGKPVTVMPKQTACGCEEVTPCASSCYRKPLMRKFAGFVYGTITNDEVDEEQVAAGCASGCGCLDLVNLSGENDAQIFWDVKTKKLIEGAALTFTKLDAIGYQSRETVEAVGEFAFTEGDVEGKVTLAGFGKRGKRANGVIMLKNLSGFFAGEYPCLCTTCGTTEESPCEDVCETAIALPWTICGDVVAEDDEGTTAAYGKWTLKWNDTAAQRLTKSFSPAALVKPGYQAPSVED